jgi:hypothetical protein
MKRLLLFAVVVMLATIPIGIVHATQMGTILYPGQSSNVNFDSGFVQGGNVVSVVKTEDYFSQPHNATQVLVVDDESLFHTHIYTDVPDRDEVDDTWNFILEGQLNRSVDGVPSTEGTFSFYFAYPAP